MISVLVCAQNEAHLIPQLRTSLSSQTKAPELTFHFHPTRPDRYAGAQKAKGDLILFLDQDCELPRAPFLQELEDFFFQHPKIQCLSGSYASPPQANMIAGGYNQMCNLWLRSGNGKNLLGGCFVIRRNLLPLLKSEPKDWGGEDTFFARVLKMKEVFIYTDPRFFVIHHDAGSFSKFVSRAWRHGQARRQLQLKTRPQKNQWRELITELPKIKLNHIFVICLHFAIVEISCLTFRVLHRAKHHRPHP